MLDTKLLTASIFGVEFNFCPEIGGNMVFRNVGTKLQGYTVSQPRDHSLLHKGGDKSYLAIHHNENGNVWT
jgi:hypothetical protein